MAAVSPLGTLVELLHLLALNQSRFEKGEFQLFQESKSWRLSWIHTELQKKIVAERQIWDFQKSNPF
jgi:hypothetical protein